jgi:hypothetical protein
MAIFPVEHPPPAGFFYPATFSAIVLNEVPMPDYRSFLIYASPYRIMQSHEAFACIAVQRSIR